MATLTPLSKGLIGLAVIGAVASAVWHLGLKEKMGGAATPPASQAQSAPAAPTVATPPVAVSPAPTSVAPPPAEPAKPGATMSAAESGEMGRKLFDSGNHAQARVYLEQAVQGGDGAAACHLGEMTLKGQGGIKADQEKAASLFRIAQSRNIICFASSK